MKTVSLILLFVCCFSGCRHNGNQRSVLRLNPAMMASHSQTPVRIEPGTPLEPFIGKRVELVGTVSEDRIPEMQGVELRGMEWFRGKQMLVSGKLQCTANSAGHSQYKTGGSRLLVYWLSDLTWSSLTPSTDQKESKATTDEPDILEIAQKNPTKVYTSGSGNDPWKLAAYGDPYLAAAVDALSDIPRPWTVPKIILQFEKESEAWQKKLQQQIDSKSVHMWAGWEKEEKRCAHLARLLAASRDPRVAVVLASALDSPSLQIRVGASEGLHLYFLSDARYHQLPPDTEIKAFTNVLPENRRLVLEWWAINKDDLLKPKISPTSSSNTSRRISFAGVGSVRLEVEQPTWEPQAQIRVSDFAARNYGKKSVSCDIYYVGKDGNEQKLKPLTLNQTSPPSEEYSGLSPAEEDFTHGSMIKVVYQSEFLRLPISTWCAFYYH